jgi:hypothetical protein
MNPILALWHYSQTVRMDTSSLHLKFSEHIYIISSSSYHHHHHMQGLNLLSRSVLKFYSIIFLLFLNHVFLSAKMKEAWDLFLVPSSIQVLANYSFVLSFFLSLFLPFFLVFICHLSHSQLFLYIISCFLRTCYSSAETASLLITIRASLLYIRYGSIIKTKTKLHGLSPRANYTDRATAACRRSYCKLLRIEGATWSA